MNTKTTQVTVVMSTSYMFVYYQPPNIMYITVIQYLFHNNIGKKYNINRHNNTGSQFKT